jgi:hypothetical protein
MAELVRNPRGETQAGRPRPGEPGATPIGGAIRGANSRPDSSFEIRRRPQAAPSTAFYRGSAATERCRSELPQFPPLLYMKTPRHRREGRRPGNQPLQYLQPRESCRPCPAVGARLEALERFPCLQINFLCDIFGAVLIAQYTIGRAKEVVQMGQRLGFEPV